MNSFICNYHTYDKIVLKYLSGFPKGSQLRLALTRAAKKARNFIPRQFLKDSLGYFVVS